jgi:two-component system phosphate regulon sensor histidine kinase PhoR
MPDWLVRTLLGAITVMAAGAAGVLLGSLVEMPAAGAVVAAAGAAAWIISVQLRSAHLLLGWLRGPEGLAAPSELTGLWADLAARVERQQRSQAAAVETERRRLTQFLAAIEASPNGVMLLDAAEQIAWMNATAADHFGLDARRDLGQQITHLLRAPAFVGHLQAGRYGEPVVFNGPLARSTLSVLVRRYGEGMKLVLSQDITERERADAMRRDFVANVSHEIRTPLTVLGGFVETMASLPLTEPERQRVLHLMTQQTERMQALVADLLTLARLEGSPRPPGDRWHALGDLFQRVAADGATLSAGRHALSTQGGEDAEIAGSDSELLSAVGNLVTNAVRYTPPGGCIEVRWRWRDDGSGAIEVADNGIGIAREHLPRLTERFYRVDISRARDTGGTGLGLSIVKHVIQRHGGEIEVESEPGAGSTFRLVLPAARLRRVATVLPRAADGQPAADPVVP